MCKTISCILTSEFKPKAVGVLLWDQDFESLSEEYRFCFGQQADLLTEFMASFARAAIDWDFGATNASAVEDLLNAPPPPPELKSLFCYKIESADLRVAMVLVGGDSNMTAKDLSDILSLYPLQHALSNGYEVAELRREANRVREQYELLETDYQEEKRLNSTTGKQHSSFKVEQHDKERLVYEISNAVRSSLDIQDVLHTAVIKIGQAFHLSRCMVIWPMPNSDEYTVYEYADEAIVPGKKLFFSDDGHAFVRVAQAKSAPHNFSAEQDTFDKNFLDQFGFLSGMLVPLIYHDRNIGSMFLQDCTTDREWSIDNTALIGSLADLITVAIEHANLHEEKKRQAVTDGLTGIANRRHFNDSFTKEFERAKRYGNCLSLAIFDLDFLKKINDTYGHNVGDSAIKAIGRILSNSCRAVDVAARFGGEEFCLLLPDTDEEDALNLAERVRNLIYETPIEGPGNISASVGVATYPQHANEQDELFEAADQALYAAKHSGKEGGS